MRLSIVPAGAAQLIAGAALAIAISSPAWAQDGVNTPITPGVSVPSLTDGAAPGTIGNSIRNEQTASPPPKGSKVKADDDDFSGDTISVTGGVPASAAAPKSSADSTPIDTANTPPEPAPSSAVGAPEQIAPASPPATSTDSAPMPPVTAPSPSSSAESAPATAAPSAATVDSSSSPAAAAPPASPPPVASPPVVVPGAPPPDVSLAPQPEAPPTSAPAPSNATTASPPYVGSTTSTSADTASPPASSNASGSTPSQPPVAASSTAEPMRPTDNAPSASAPAASLPPSKIEPAPSSSSAPIAMTPVARAPAAVEPVVAPVASPPVAAAPPPEVNAAPRYDTVSSTTTTAEAPRAPVPVEFTPTTAADAARASAPAPVSTTRVPESATAPINAASIAPPVTFAAPATDAPPDAGRELPASETIATQPVATTGKKSKKAKGGNKADSDANTKVASNPPNEGGFAGLQFGNSKSPIDIKSESMSLDYEHHAILWTGHVHANQANAQLTSDRLHVNYLDKDFKEMKDIVAEGNVRISQGTRWATGDHGVMDQTKHTMVLTGSPVVHDGTDQITGSKITVYLDTGRSVVDGAHAVIFPHQAEEQDNSAAKNAPAEQ